MDSVASPTAGVMTAAQSTTRPAGAAQPRRTRWIIAALVVFGVIPVALGVAHLATVLAGMDVSAKALYFLAAPVPIALHVLGAAIYVLLGPLQFSPALRRQAPRWHRMAGRLLVVSGLAVGLSALWMTLTLPHQAGGGDLLFAARLVFGSAMIGAIGYGFWAIRQGEVSTHRRWMTRAYAIGLGAGTQIPVLMVAEIIAGHPSDLTRAVLMGGSWVINVAIAEWALRRRPAR